VSSYLTQPARAQVEFPNPTSIPKTKLRDNTNALTQPMVKSRKFTGILLLLFFTTSK